MTNSKVPRDTKSLVAGVGQKKIDVSSAPCLSESPISLSLLTQEPGLVNEILEAIQSISDEARRALADAEMPREDLLSVLSASDPFLRTNRSNDALSQDLIHENHRHLVSLGVSHPALEIIRSKTASPYGLSTKLTGAGGGGCAVTLVPDGKQYRARGIITKPYSTLRLQGRLTETASR